MKNSSLLLAFLVSGLSFFACRDGDDNNVVPDYPSKIEERTFTSAALQGNLFGDPAERDMLVYTPRGYDPNGTKSYPVVYLLHGVPLGDSSFVDPAKWAAGTPWGTPDFPSQGFHKWIDSLIENGAIEPMPS